MSTVKSFLPYDACASEACQPHAMALANQTNSLLTGEAERLRARLEDAGIQVPLGHCASALKTHGNDPHRAEPLKRLMATISAKKSQFASFY